MRALDRSLDQLNAYSKEEIVAFKVYPISKYNYSIDGRGGYQVRLWGSDGKQRLRVTFTSDAGQLPPLSLAPGLESGTCWLKASALPALVDMLRNEDPVSVTLNDQPPGFVFVHTGVEPVGVGDEEASVGE